MKYSKENQKKGEKVNSLYAKYSFVSDAKLSDYPHYVSLIYMSTYPFLNANPSVQVRYEVERVHL
jgi:hypothetical protein